MTSPQQPQTSLPEAEGSRSLTDQAYRRIEELIVTLRLQPGEVLSESALSAMLGIGRTPIREAIQRLAGEGLVTVLPRKGLLVSDINPRRQLLLLELRREIERLLARKAAVRQTARSAPSFSGLPPAWKPAPSARTTSASCVSTARSTG
jgi:DNA-binding GntR family transcriptional regulator